MADMLPLKIMSAVGIAVRMTQYPHMNLNAPVVPQSHYLIPTFK